jgi:hypothetical protein
MQELLSSWGCRQFLFEDSHQLIEIFCKDKKQMKRHDKKWFANDGYLESEYSFYEQSVFYGNRDSEDNKITFPQGKIYSF